MIVLLLRAIQGDKTERKAINFEKLQGYKRTFYSRQDFVKRFTSGRSVLQSNKYDIGRIGSGFVEKKNTDGGTDKKTETIKNDIILRDVNIDVDEILLKVKNVAFGYLLLSKYFHCNKFTEEVF